MKMRLDPFRAGLLMGAAFLMAPALECDTQQPSSSHQSLPLMVTISTERDTFQKGAAIQLKIILRNLSRHETRIGIRLPFEYALEVRTADGGDVPDTKLDRIEKGKEEPSGGRTASPVLVTLEPGQAFDEDPMVVGDFYDLSTPGKYQIQLTRSDRVSNTVLMSNTINITITP